MKNITMQKDPLQADSQERGEQVSIQKAKAIKLGIDVHARKYVVVRQMDHATPQPAQSFTPDGFLKWAEKQKQLGEKVYACYEAGFSGFGLARKLLAMGVECYVICPQDWDERNQGVKNDARDAREMVIRLDRYVQGNRNALAVVRVPTPEEEQSRCISRQREQLSKEKLRLAAQGRSLMMCQGIAPEGGWWKPRCWERLQIHLPSWMVARLEVLRPILLLIEEKLQQVTQQLEQSAKPGVPNGFGALTCETLNREVGDWSRFKNRRQVASYTGLCPGQHSSGDQQSSLSITKHGNPRVRHPLIQLAWRVIQFQPQYPPVKKWRCVLGNPKATAAARKKAIVAIGRRLAVDLWRLNTQRCKADDLHLIVKN